MRFPKVCVYVVVGWCYSGATARMPRYVRVIYMRLTGALTPTLPSIEMWLLIKALRSRYEAVYSKEQR
jgi:hypothetical protein